MNWNDDNSNELIRSAGLEPSREPRLGHDDTLIKIIWRQRWTVVTFLALALAIVGVYLIVATPLYIVTAQVYVQRSNNSAIGDKGFSQTTGENFLYTQAGMLKSSQTIGLALGMPGADEMKTFKGVRNKIAYLKNNLQVEVGKRDDIISISFDSAYPEEGKKLVNAIVESYTTRASRDTRSTAQEMLALLEKEKDKLEVTLAKKSEKLVEFKRTYNTVAFEGEKGNLTTDRLKGTGDALNSAHLATMEARAAFEEVAKSAGLDPDDKALDKPGSMTISAENQDKLRGELFDLRQRREDLKHQYLDNHPISRTLDARITQLQSSLIGSSRQRWVAARQREQDLQRAFDDQNKQATELSWRSTEYNRLNKDVSTLEDTIATLDNRVKEVALAGDAGQLNITVVDEANFGEKPDKPNKINWMLIAAGVGLTLGISIGLVREWVNPSLHSEEDIKAALGVPVLGVVPRVLVNTAPEAHGWAVQNAPESPVAEAYRSVRTAVSFSAPGGRAKTIAITSPSDGDGKSTLVSNLAIAMAKAGKRVLVLDADFRNPSQQRIFGVSDENGFSSVLGAGEEVDRAIRRTAVERLDVLPAGPLPRDPSELLNSPDFTSVLEQLTKLYDHVLIDSPATAGVSDARIIAASCDVTILVMRAEKLNRRTAENARDGLLAVGAQLLGVVMNDVPVGARGDDSGSGVSGLPMIDRAVAKVTGATGPGSQLSRAEISTRL